MRIWKWIHPSITTNWGMFFVQGRVLVSYGVVRFVLSEIWPKSVRVFKEIIWKHLFFSSVKFPKVSTPITRKQMHVSHHIWPGAPKSILEWLDRVQGPWIAQYIAEKNPYSVTPCGGFSCKLRCGKVQAECPQTLLPLLSFHQHFLVVRFLNIHEMNVAGISKAGPFKGFEGVDTLGKRSFKL